MELRRQSVPLPVGRRFPVRGKHPKRPVPAAQPSPLSELAAAYRRCQARKASKPSAARLTAAATRCKSVPFHSISTVCSPAGISTVSSPEVGGRVDSRGLTASMRACQPGSRRSSGAAQTAVRRGCAARGLKSPSPAGATRRAPVRVNTVRVERKCDPPSVPELLDGAVAFTRLQRTLVNLDLGEYGRRRPLSPARRRPSMPARLLAEDDEADGRRGQSCAQRRRSRCRATPPANNARGRRGARAAATQTG